MAAGEEEVVPVEFALRMFPVLMWHEMLHDRILHRFYLTYITLAVEIMIKLFDHIPAVVFSTSLPLLDLERRRRSLTAVNLDHLIHSEP